MLSSIRQWAAALGRDVVAVYFAARDSRTPWPVRLLALLVAGYALSPVDLIPDFIPVLGYLDDLLLVPLGLWLLIRLIPAPVLAAARERARSLLARPRGRIAAVLVICIWMLAGGLMVYWLAVALGGAG